MTPVSSFLELRKFWRESGPKLNLVAGGGGRGWREAISAELKKTKTRTLKIPAFTWDCTCRGASWWKGPQIRVLYLNTGMYLDDEAEWKDIISFFCARRFTWTQTWKQRTPASRKPGDLSYLRVLTLAVPSAGKTAWEAPDPCLTAPSHHPGLSVDVTFSETFLSLSVQCSLGVPLTQLVLIAYLLLHISCLALPHPHAKPPSLPTATDLPCPTQ